MASRRSAQRFLASLVRSASPRAIALGLAGAALFASGCGSSSSTSESSVTTGARQAQAGTVEQKNPAPKSRQEGTEGPSDPSKHAPKVKIPSGEREPPITPKRKAQATVASVALESPSFVKPDGIHVALPKSATCEGEDTPPTLRWKGLPEDAEELVLFAMSFMPVEKEIFFDWAVAGLDPGLTEIKAGKLPAEAILGKNSFGRLDYSICPPKGKGETYVFYLFALPKPLSPKRGFDPTVLRKEALAQHANAGFLVVTYHVY